MAKAAKKKVPRKRAPKPADGEIQTKRAKAYAEMESHLCAVVNWGMIASNLFDSTDRGLYDFAVRHLAEMLDDLKAATTPGTSGHETCPVLDHVRAHLSAVLVGLFDSDDLPMVLPNPQEAVENRHPKAD